MAISDIDLLEEAHADLVRADGRVLTALAHIKVEKRERLAAALKVSKPAVKKEKAFMLSTLEAHIVAVIGSVISLVVGLGVLSPSSGGTIVSIAGVALSAIFVITNEVKGLALAKAGRGGEIK